MRFKILFGLIKKEITDVVRDKKTLFAMIGMPLVLYPVLMIVFSMISQTMNAQIASDTTLVLVNGDMPTSFVEFLEQEQYELLQFVEEVAEGEENEYTLTFEQDGTVDIEYDSTIEIQGFTVSDFRNMFDEYSNYQMQNALQENSIELDLIETDEIVFTDIASDTQSLGLILGQILPILLLLGVTLGVIYPAIDIVAGEKERNTLETLLSMPVTSLEIVTSKFVTIAICGVVSAVLNIASVGFSMWYLVASMLDQSSGDAFLAGLDMSQMITPLIVTTICLVTFTFFVSAITMIIVSLANSFKEAQNYISPLMIVIILPSYVTMLPTIKLDATTSFIPIINIALLVKEMFTFDFQLSNIFLVIISNLAYCALAIVILGKVFGNESILFGNKKSFKLLEGRNNLQYGGVPAVTDGIVLFTVGIVSVFYISGIVNMLVTSIEIVLIITQMIIIAFPLLYCYYIKCDFRETFGLRKFDIKYLAMGIPMAVVAFFTISFIQNIMLDLIPSLQTLVDAMEDAIDLGGLLSQIVVISVLPAICEEVFFRGFLLKSFKVDKYPVMAIILTSLLFGIFHMNVLQFVTGLLLGLVLGFVTYKSKSIYPAMILHFLNNATAVVIGYYTG